MTIDGQTHTNVFEVNLSTVSDQSNIIGTLKIDVNSIEDLRVNGSGVVNWPINILSIPSTESYSGYDSSVQLIPNDTST